MLLGFLSDGFPRFGSSLAHRAEDDLQPGSVWVGEVRRGGRGGDASSQHRLKNYLCAVFTPCHRCQSRPSHRLGEVGVERQHRLGDFELAGKPDRCPTLTVDLSKLDIAVSTKYLGDFVDVCPVCT